MRVTEALRRALRNPIRTEQAAMTSKTISLTRGFVTIVDDADYDYLMQWKWFCDYAGYAKRNMPEIKGEKKGCFYMHRIIMCAPIGLEVDHINWNKLDNRRENLRLCYHAQNGMNKAGLMNASSKYKGVCWCQQTKKWKATIQVNKKQIWLGRFDSEIDAALTYNVAAEKYQGEFAHLNEISYVE